MTSSPGVATERPGELSDDQIMAVLQEVTRDELFRMLTFKRWKDGIDIDHPTFAAQRLAAEFRAAEPVHPSPDSKLEAYRKALEEIQVTALAGFRDGDDEAAVLSSINNRILKLFADEVEVRKALAAGGPAL